MELPLPQIDTELAARVLKQVRDFPEQHNQGGWHRVQLDVRERVCGTTYCVAGWAVHFGRPDLTPVMRTAGYNTFRHATCLVDADGEQHLYSETAMEVLGVTDREAEWLFSACRSRNEVLGALKSLAQGQRLDIAAISTGCLI